MAQSDQPHNETNYSPARWRVIVSDAQDGATNMAIDEAIARAVATGDVLPTLRFYTWSPPCLSLGYGQPASDVDSKQIAARGWHLVRRLSGGRAILHTDELTYSVAVPADDSRVAGSIVESYQRLSQGLMHGLTQMGASVRSEQADRVAHRFKGPVCFEVPSDYEITMNGRKLIGSAQTRRSAQAILQHGTLPLTGELERICSVLTFQSEAARRTARTRVLERAITLEEGLGRPVSFTEAAEALQAGFAAALNLTFIAGMLTADEQSKAAALRANKYATDAWTFRH